MAGPQAAPQAAPQNIAPGATQIIPELTTGNAANPAQRVEQQLSAMADPAGLAEQAANAVNHNLGNQTLANASYETQAALAAAREAAQSTQQLGQQVGQLATSFEQMHQNQAAASQTAAQQAQQQALQLTPEEQATYHGSLPVINKLVQQSQLQMQQQFEQQLATQQAEFERQLTEVRGSTESIQGNLQQQHATAIQGAAQQQGINSAVINSPEFQQFLEQPMNPGMPISAYNPTLREAYNSSLSNVTADSVQFVQGMYSGFRQLHPLAQPGQMQPAGVQTPQARPVVANGQVPVQTNNPGQQAQQEQLVTVKVGNEMRTVASDMQGLAEQLAQNEFAIQTNATAGIPPDEIMEWTNALTTQLARLQSGQQHP